MIKPQIIDAPRWVHLIHLSPKSSNKKKSVCLDRTTEEVTL
jgi:hypothetical protein